MSIFFNNEAKDGKETHNPWIKNCFYLLSEEENWVNIENDLRCNLEKKKVM